MHPAQKSPQSHSFSKPSRHRDAAWGSHCAQRGGGAPGAPHGGRGCPPTQRSPCCRPPGASPAAGHPQRGASVKWSISQSSNSILQSVTCLGSYHFCASCFTGQTAKATLPVKSWVGTTGQNPEFYTNSPHLWGPSSAC